MSNRLYSLLLQLYPRAFRERYAEEMARVFRDRLRHETAARVWVDVLGDALVSIPRQHWRQEPHPIYPASAAPLRDLYGVVGQTLVLTALLSASATFLGLSLVMTSVPQRWLLPSLLVLVMMFFLWVVAARKMLRASQTFKAYRAEASADTVTVVYGGATPLTLRRSDIIALRDFEKVGLRIQTADPARDLWVPARAASYPAVRALLAQWAPVTVTPFRVTVGDGSVPHLAFVYALALVPMRFAGGIGVVLGFNAILALVKPDLAVHKRLLYLGPVAILVLRWLW
jgi:hypothetical protein